MAKFSINLWNDLKSLNAQEIDCLRKYEQEPRGLGFILVGDILRRRGHVDEAIKVLEEGIITFPDVLSARVALGRDYFLKGRMSESSLHLGFVLMRTPDNLLAQRLMLKLAFVSNNKIEAEKRLSELQVLFKDDEPTRILRDAVRSGEWERGRKYVYMELRRFNIVCDAYFPEFLEKDLSLKVVRTDGLTVSLDSTSLKAWTAAVKITAKSPDGLLSDNDTVIASAGAIARVILPTPQRSAATADLSHFRMLRGYDPPHSANASKSVGVSIEAEKLAEVFIAQGYYRKAVEIYERLVSETPADVSLSNRRDDAVGLLATFEEAERRRLKLTFLTTLLDKLEARRDEAEMASQRR